MAPPVSYMALPLYGIYARACSTLVAYCVILLQESLIKQQQVDERVKSNLQSGPCESERGVYSAGNTTQPLQYMLLQVL